MSRLYEMHVSVTPADRKKLNLLAVSIAACEVWNFDNVVEDSDTEYVAYGLSQLCGGESEEDFSKRLTRAIWHANGEYCEVEVRCTYMEDLPCETYSFDEDDYEKMTQKTD